MSTFKQKRFQTKRFNLCALLKTRGATTRWDIIFTKLSHVSLPSELHIIWWQMAIVTKGCMVTAIQGFWLFSRFFAIFWLFLDQLKNDRSASFQQIPFNSSKVQRSYVNAVAIYSHHFHGGWINRWRTRKVNQEAQKKCIENMDESYNGEFENQSIKQ